MDKTNQGRAIMISRTFHLSGLGVLFASATQDCGDVLHTQLVDAADGLLLS